MRPLLGGRAATTGGGGTTARTGEVSPTQRVPGASVAARATEHAGGATWADVAAARVPRADTARPTGNAGAGNAPTTNATTGDEGRDDDGFRTVLGRRGRKGGALAAAGEGATQGGDRNGGSVEARGDGDEADARDASRGDGGGADEPPSAADLQKRWHEEVALVKRLRSQGIADSHPAMRAACAARDEAEQDWRGSKEPAPATVRLGRAQQKLDRAVALQADARRAILEAEEAHREKMSQLQAVMDECNDRVRLRRRQLGDVQEELGAGGARAAGARRAQQQAIQQVHQTICAEVGPAIASLVEQLDTDAPAWATLNGLLGKLAVSKEALENVTTHPTDEFDIGDHDDGDDNRADDGDDATEWSESHDVSGQSWGKGTPGDGWHDWGGSKPYGDGDTHDQSMGTGDWWDEPVRRWGGAVRWQASGHGHWTRANWADQLEEEQGTELDGDGQPPAARRRLDAAGSDQATKDANAQEQQQQHQQQPTAQASATGGPTGGAACGDQDEQRRKHSERINHIVHMAVEAGVTPLTKTGEDLVVLDPAQLEAWVAECLPAALLC